MSEEMNKNTATDEEVKYARLVLENARQLLTEYLNTWSSERSVHVAADLCRIGFQPLVTGARCPDRFRAVIEAYHYGHMPETVAEALVG